MIWQINKEEYEKVIDHMLKGFPLEACGLFLGPIDSEYKPSGEIVKFWPTNNAAGSARIYEIDSKDQLKASRYVSDNKLEIIGVVHSHTHSEAYPSPTDVNFAIDPSWLYSIVSLKDEEIVMNSFQIQDENVETVKCEII